jgi:hypothetical protein
MFVRMVHMLVGMYISQDACKQSHAKLHRESLKH